MTPVLQSHFADYAAFHRTAGNKACHSFGIPIIVLASLALLARVPLFALGDFTVTLAEAVIALFLAYYLTLDRTLAFLMLVAYASLDAVGRLVPPLPALASPPFSPGEPPRVEAPPALLPPSLLFPPKPPLEPFEPAVPPLVSGHVVVQRQSSAKVSPQPSAMRSGTVTLTARRASGRVKERSACFIRSSQRG